MKRGQVTVFIIVGIIILAVTGIIFFLVGNTTTEEIQSQNDFPEQLTSLQTFVEECVHDAVIEGIYLTLANGGYVQVPTNSEILEFIEDDELFTVPYYFDSTRQNAPSLEEIEEQTSQASISPFTSCINEFEPFTDIGDSIQAQEPIIDITFAQGETLVLLEYALEVSTESATTDLSYFRTIIPLDFSSKYETVVDFLAKQEQDPEYFLVGSLSSLSYEHNYLLDFTQQGDLGSEVLVSLTLDENLKEDPLVYNFGLLYDWEEQSVEIEAQEPIVEELTLSHMEPWSINQEGVHTYQLEAQGENITFEADTDSFDLDQTSGLISLDTANFVNDEYWYFIRVRDAYNREVTAPLYININVNNGHLPQIESIGTLNAIVGEEFMNQVFVSNNPDNLPLFFDDTYSQFPINRQTGVLELVPTEEMVGTYSLRVDVENEFGRTWERFELVVE